MQYSSLLPPVGVWTVLSSSVADRPLRPATDHRLGGPLPHQLANRPQAPPKASPKTLPSLDRSPGTLRGISHPFEWLSPSLGQITYVLLTRPPLTGYESLDPFRNFEQFLARRPFQNRRIQPARSTCMC